MKKIWAVLAPALLLMPLAGYAVSSAELEAELEKADRAARQNAEETYKGFNPHLTDAQMKEIPALIEGATERLNSAGYGFTEADVMEGLYIYLAANHGLVFPPSVTVDEVMPDGRIVPQELQLELNEEGLLKERALKYAFFKLIPADKRGNFQYQPSAYPEITDWQEFHNMCQADMNEIYKLLKNVQNCDWESFKEVFGNLM